MIMFKILILIACYLVTVSVAKPPMRQPINSDFVNGPWARIGKRTMANDDYCAYALSNNSIELLPLKIYIKCLEFSDSKIQEEKIDSTESALGQPEQTTTNQSDNLLDAYLLNLLINLTLQDQKDA